MNNLKSTCPKCNSTDICEINYGYPADEEEYLKLVAEKKIHPGGCCIDEDSPAWYCNDCKNKWGKLDSDKTDSFDYDQGFNIEEVYDQ